MPLKHVVMLLAVLGILLLYFLSSFSQPCVIRIQELPAYEGKHVIVEGIVIDHHTTAYGSQIIEIQDRDPTESNTKATIFAEKATPVEYGDTIQVTGKVQKYKDDWEVVVNEERLVRIIQKWQNRTTPLWQLAQNPERYAGINVNVTGLIDRVYDHYFYLVDTEEDYSIVVFCDPSTLRNVSQGDTVSVAATFAYTAADMRYVLNVDEENHHIWLMDQ